MRSGPPAKRAGRRRARRRDPFRSMEWLRGAGSRLRAMLLLVAFAIGSIFARDALMVHELLMLQAELEAAPTELDEAPELRATEAQQAPKIFRPSGVSRRTAMNPFDPPDDDDELDQDSDTLAVGHIGFTVPPPAAGALVATFVGARFAPAERTEHSPYAHLRSVNPRAPPAGHALG